MTDPNQPPQNTPPAYEAPAYSAPAYPNAPQYGSGGPAPDAPVPGKTLGIVAFVLSFFVQLVALILGIIALVQSRKAGHKNGFALAAIIISVVLGVIAIIIAIIVISTLATVGGDVNQVIELCMQNGGGTVELYGQQFDCEQLLQN
ncbi:DUF4190 domain-containing protein [Microbacterium sp. 179-B 1A2 NHS]|uniref:DUF4190 domain-containing protein n=1 Tax=Microbacterium sp. 179-B 1A2 NHS TaxID=3142383 RepID=UPI0039A3A4AC